MVDLPSGYRSKSKALWRKASHLVTLACKLRVATPDSPDALLRVQDAFEETAGVWVEPQLQEIDRGELIVEVLVSDRPLIPLVTPSTRLAAQAVGGSDVDVSVLSAWVEERPESIRTKPLRVTSVEDSVGRSDCEAIERATQDDVATAVWCPTAVRGGTGDSGVWQLAVPFYGPDWSSCVAVSERSGYPYRFSSDDALGFRTYLESTDAVEWLTDEMSR